MTDVPALSVRDLKFRYAPGDDWIIDIPELDIGAGEQVLLTGGSGRGKSTLLYLVAGLVQPGAGSVHVRGSDLFGMRHAARDEFRGRAMGMIFQTFNLLHGFSALENVMMAMVVSEVPRRDQRRRAEALLAELGIDRPHAEPHRLSVGQQQRVAVARAVACKPAIVLADEPTASLDPANAAAAMDLIQSTCANHGSALLCTSHDPTMIGRFERCIALDALAAAPAAP